MVHSVRQRKTQHEPHRRIERFTEDSEPIVECDDFAIPDVAALD